MNDAHNRRRPRVELRARTLEAARAILAAEGLRGITARRLADACGYAVGTLYNLFDTTDALVAELNLETLAALEDTLRRQPPPDGATSEAAVLHVARVALDFTTENRQRWSAVLEFTPVAPHAYRDATAAVVERLIGHLEAALGRLGQALAPGERRMAAAVLWAGFEGIAGLTAANSLALVSKADAWAMVRYLVQASVAGIAAKAAGKRARDTTQRSTVSGSRDP
jgi:AcrR family transcriptional regulator